MKKFFDSLKFVSKTILLILLLLAGWTFVNITNLVKGKKIAKDSDTSGLWGPGEARADDPSCKGSSTPFLACFDGKKFNLENDFLFGRPKSYWYTYKEGKQMYEDGRISPDLYKIAAEIVPQDGKLLFQIQEIELEESFFKWLELKRIVHPQNTEVIVDSEYKKFYVLSKEEFVQSIRTPQSVSMNGIEVAEAISDKKIALDNDVKNNQGIRFEPNGSVSINFSGLTPGKTPHLIVKSWFRDWVLGLEDEWTAKNCFSFSQIFKEPRLTRSLLALFLLPLFGFLQKRGVGDSMLAALPLVAGSGTMCVCSFVYEYKDSSGQYNAVTISEPRAWHYNTEVIELPRESVSPDGRMSIRIRSSKRHTLGFVGVSQEIEKLNVDCREEKLTLLEAKHDRLEKDFAPELADKQSSSYMHAIPGDKVSLKFAASKLVLGNEEKETYLIRASGFYTSLRPESRILAGNWQERISEEAKNRLASLVRLNNYS